MHDSVIQINGLVKKYGDKSVINELDLEIFKGECFGLLGPNGAGKSSTMQVLYGSNRMSAGDVYILGLNVRRNMKEIKSRIGIVPQDDGLDFDFNVRENLELFGSYHQLKGKQLQDKVEDLLRLVRLEAYADSNIDALSGGMKRRLAIARGIINSPEILILDEPTTGLDPQARIWIWEFIKNIKAEGGTVFLSTHYMEEAEQICDRIGIMDKGKILSVGSPTHMIQNHIGHQVVEVEVDPKDIGYYQGRLDANKLNYQVIHNHINVHLQKDQDPKKVLDIIHGKKVTMRAPSLNDVFLKLAGHDLRDEPI